MAESLPTGSLAVIEPIPYNNLPQSTDILINIERVVLLRLFLFAHNGILLLTQPLPNSMNQSISSQVLEWQIIRL